MAQVNVFLLGGSKKDHLASALTHLFAQTFTDYEIIVSEQGEGDGIVIVIEIENIERALRRPDDVVDLFNEYATAEMTKRQAHD